jgi:uncharacterized protein YecE (DUF72 family)
MLSLSRLRSVKRGHHYIGTSGWSYAGWKSGFYAGVRNKDWLQYCAQRFTALEINGTFYRQVRPETFAKWRDSVPTDFRFAIKGHRFLTHHKKLDPPRESVERQRDQAAALGDKLAAVLWQLPATLAKNLQQLETFANHLRVWPRVAHALEFRHPSWFDREVADTMHRFHLTVCQSDAATWPMWEAVTSTVVYVRLHGHTVTYQSNYPDNELFDWAIKVNRWKREGRDVHVYFDNDAHGHAPHNAVRLLELLEQVSGAAHDST